MPVISMMSTYVVYEQGKPVANVAFATSEAEWCGGGASVVYIANGTVKRWRVILADGQEWTQALANSLYEQAIKDDERGETAALEPWLKRFV